MYTAITRDIEVNVEPSFQPDRSSVREGLYFWIYKIVIANKSRETVQLKARYWVITDSVGQKRVVKGDGVVGEQPVLKPGEEFKYTSGVPLPTSSGFMTGSYRMVTDAGESFDIDIPAFSLDSPDARRTLN